jgi:hypothetical protein
MGGSIAVTVRDPNGKEYRMCRWTNSLPGFINDIGLINKDPKHLEEYLEQWKGMVEDWKSHIKKCKKEDHIDCTFKYNMTPVYAPESGLLIPIEYGLVIVDMQNNVILSCQGYSCPGHVHMCFNTDPETLKQINIFATNQRITSCMDFYHPKVKDLSNKIPKVIEKFMASPLKPRSVFYELTFDLSPYKIIEVEEHNYVALREQVIKLGFKLSDEENKMWDEAIKEREEED